MAENNEKRRCFRVRYIRLIFAFLVLILIEAEPVLAEEGLSIEPVFQNISFSAEVSQTDFFVTLTNKTTRLLTLYPSVVDFGSLDESGGVAFLGSVDNLERKYGLASWMRLEKDVLFLDPGEREQIRVVIENRDSLFPGGHYGAVLFQISTDGSGKDENVVSVNQSISMLVFVQKKGGERYTMELKEVSLSSNPLLIPTRIRLRFQNGGNIHVVPRGVVTLTDPFGRVVKRGSINPESGLVLPETQRVYTTKLYDTAQIFFPGLYTVAIAYRYDGRDEFSFEERTIILVPWQGITVLGFGGLLYSLIRWLSRKKALKRGEKQESTT